MTLYNCRHSGDQYRITKFDSDMNPQGSYLVDGEACECPAGVRSTCRHREMLPKFIQRDHIGDEWFYDYDRGGWVQMGSEWAAILSPNDILNDMPMEESAPTGATSLPEGESEPQVTAASVGADRDFNWTQDQAMDDWRMLTRAATVETTDMPPLPKGITMIVLDSPNRVVDVHNAITDAVGEPQMPPSAKPFKRRF